MSDTRPTIESDELRALRDRVAALRAPACAMAHETIPLGSDGKPKRTASTQSGYVRPGICDEEKRATHLACSHTTARYILRQALTRIGGANDMLEKLRALENDISLLDHRRFDAEARRADALLAGANDAQPQADIAAAVAEHRACTARALALRDEVLRRLDEAIGR